MIDKKTQKVQTIVTDYHRFVLEGLVGIQGGSISDVLSSVLTQVRHLPIISSIFTIKIAQSLHYIL
jgi:hypothetical protein